MKWNIFTNRKDVLLKKTIQQNYKSVNKSLYNKLIKQMENTKSSFVKETISDFVYKYNGE